MRRRDPATGASRLFGTMIERDLFGAIRLVWRWTSGGRSREASADYPDEEAAGAALEELAAAKRPQGYEDV